MSTPATNQRLLTYVDALREAVAQEMKRDPRVFVFGLDVDDHKAIQGSTRGLVDDFGPDRVFGTPLSEDAMTGVAIGAAMAGMRPIHVHIRMDFLMLCMNQLVNIAAKSSYMYDGQVKVPLVVRSMIGKSWGQGAQHSQGLHSMFMHVPGLKVVAPSNAYDAKGCLISAIRDDNPVIFVEHRLLYFTDAFVPEEIYEVPFGKARVCTQGDDITIVGISNMLVECLRAHELLADIGIQAEVIDPISLVPLDIDTIVKSVKRTGRLLVVDNAWTSCGASAEIVAQVVERAQNGKPIRIQRMGYAPVTCPTTPALEREFYPDPAKIAKAVHAMVKPDAKPWIPDAERSKLAYQVKFRGPFSSLSPETDFERSMFYDLAVNTWGREEIDAIQRVIASDRFTIGPYVAAFEDAFAAYHQRQYCVMVNSGSSANLLAVAALFYKKDRPLQRGDEVIVPAISWATTYHPLQQYGLKLKIVDVELDTINVDVSQFEKAMGPRTRAIVGVSILGNPAALDVMRKFADDRGLYFIEDNCESMDAELADRKAGCFGHLSTFSSFFSHHISTMEGGMVTTDDRELFELVKSMRAHGWVRDLPKDSVLFEKKTDDFYEAYRFILPGYNVRPIEMSGAIGIEQLKKLPGMTAARRKNWALFQSLFKGDNKFIIQRENGKSSAFSFTIVLNPEAELSRPKIMDALRQADIGYRIITGGCITRHDVIKHYDYECVDDLPNANLAHDHGFFVGNHPTDLTTQITRLREVLDRAAR